MKEPDRKKSKIEEVGADLFHFAIDREDVKWLMARLPEEADIKPETVEYELQILKIITVGWCISYYLNSSTQKTTLLSLYWNAVNEYAQSLSATTGMLIGQQIDYFQVLKDRLDMYVSELEKHPDAPEPARVIGPAFARQCGNGDDLFTFMTGSKLFINVVARIKEYLEEIRLR